MSISRRDVLKASVAASLSPVAVSVAAAQESVKTDGFGRITEETEAEAKLKALKFDRDIIDITDGVYGLVNYGVSNVGIIETPNGLIVIDTTEEIAAATAGYKKFRRSVSKKPVLAIIYTHSHVDHPGGASVFAKRKSETAPLQIWATDNFGEATAAGEFAGIASKRGPRQAGFSLPPEQRFNQGIAIAKAPIGAFGNGSLVPTHTYAGESKEIEIDGVKLELVRAPGETEDQQFIWYPEKKVLFAGDNFYASFPNLYAIRGTPYRDVSRWSFSLAKMIAKGPEYILSGHTAPVIGAAQCRTQLTNYRMAIQSVYDQTVAGINAGMDPDTLAETVKLAPELAELPYLQEYYGTVQGAVRSIFAHRLGWFDGNATNLFRPAPMDRGKRLVDALGGEAETLLKASRAYDNGEFQWSAELVDIVLDANPESVDALFLKASALEDLSRETLNVLSRNYMQVYAGELRTKATTLQ